MAQRPLNELMHFTAGMGATGETYLVGPDRLMRSQSRFINAPTLLATKVDNASVRDASKGQSGAHIVSDYRGIRVLSVYAPVDFGGQPWILLAEIDEAKVLEARKPWIAIAAGGLAGLAVLGLALLARQLFSGVPRPNPCGVVESANSEMLSDLSRKVRR